MPTRHSIHPAANDVVDLAQLGLILRQRYRFILGMGALVFLLVVAATLAARMDFRATGRLYLGELDGKTRAPQVGQNEFDLSGGGEGEVASEIEIIRSRSLVSRAILESGQNVTLTSSQQGPLRYWKWLLSRRDPKLLDVTVAELRAKKATLIDAPRETPRYRVRFLTPAEYEVWREQTRVGRGKLGEPFEAAGLELTLYEGTQRRPVAGATYDLLVLPVDDATDRALKVLDVSAPKKMAGGESVNVLTLEFVGASPYTAASFLEQLMRSYLKERQSWKTEDASAAEAFVTTQLGVMRESLDQVQRKLAEYRSNNRVVVLDNEAKAMIEQIAKYEEQRVASRLQVAALSDIKRQLKGSNPPMGAFLLGEAQDTVLEGMATSLSEARQNLTDLETRFNDAAPDVRKQRAQVEAQLESVRNYVGSRLARAQENLGALSGIIGQFEQKLKTVPQAELGLAQLSRESEVYGRTYSYLLERQQQAGIIKASTLSKNRILDAPEVPHRENSPKLPLRVAVGLFGLLLGAAIVIAQSFFSGTFRSDSDIRRALGGTPVFALIPRRAKAKKDKNVIPALPSFELEYSNAENRFAEAFRLLRANVSGWREVQVVLVTSPNAGDGKTTCAVGLAAALAADGKRVLAIDADLRHAVQMDGLPTGPGLRAVLDGECVLGEALYEISSPSSTFQWLPSGGSARPELLSSPRMNELLTLARRSFDAVVIDAPSFPGVSDALVLASFADGVITVLRPQNTARKLATEHLDQLSAAGTYAIVINDAGRAPSSRARRSGPARPAASEPLPFPDPITAIRETGRMGTQPRSRLKTVG